MIATAALVQTNKKTATAPPDEKERPSSSSSDVGTQLAKNMATGEMILMAACLGKQGGIPRNKMGDYIAAAAEKGRVPLRGVNPEARLAWSESEQG